MADDRYARNEDFDILIIDNRELSRNATFNILTLAGYKVDTAVHGKDGIDKLLAHGFRYRLVITEIIMPYAGGFEVIEFIKKNSLVPVIVLSEIKDEYSIQSIFNLNVSDLIKKPFIAGELIQRVSRVISRNKSNPIGFSQNSPVTDSQGFALKQHQFTPASSLSVPYNNDKADEVITEKSHETYYRNTESGEDVMKINEYGKEAIVEDIEEDLETGEDASDDLPKTKTVKPTKANKALKAKPVKIQKKSSGKTITAPATIKNKTKAKTKASDKVAPAKKKVTATGKKVAATAKKTTATAKTKKAPVTKKAGNVKTKTPVAKVKAKVSKARSPKPSLLTQAELSKIAAKTIKTKSSKEASSILIG